MTNELSCTWPELKIRAKQFIDFCPAANTEDELNQIFKMFGLSYLNVEGTENEKYQASILYKICSEIYMKELFELRGY